jgi:hypothetical protein
MQAATTIYIIRGKTRQRLVLHEIFLLPTRKLFRRKINLLALT